MRWWYVMYEGATDFEPVEWWPSPPPEEALDEDYHAAFKDAEHSGRFDDRKIVRMFVADDSREHTPHIVWIHNTNRESALGYFRLPEAARERLTLREKRTD